METVEMLASIEYRRPMGKYRTYGGDAFVVLFGRGVEKVLHMMWVELDMLSYLVIPWLALD